jgi:hypothetical protein
LKNTLPITAIWLRGKGKNKLQVLVEINDKWYICLEEYAGDYPEAITISHIAEGTGRKNWMEDK